MGEPNSFLSDSQARTHLFGINLAERLRTGGVAALYGDLGAGKTALAAGICEGLGYRGRVTSPSFVYLHRYEHNPVIYHLDLYRAANAAEIADLGIDELFTGKSIVIIEWAQLFPEIIPDHALRIHLEWPLDSGETVRIIRLGNDNNVGS